jgi:hypothetical protein
VYIVAPKYKRALQMGPEKQNGHFLINGSKSSDEISVIYGNCVPK